jgi:hypothetical protein
MALNFPSSPVLGEVFQAEGATFVWNGALWVVLGPTSATFATKAEAIAGLRGDVMLSPLRAHDMLEEFTTPAPPLPNPPAAFCRAWSQYNGETLAVIRSFNIRSIVRDGARMRHTFETPMPDANYLVLGSCRGVTNHPVLQVNISASVPNTPETCDIVTGTTGGSGRTGFNANSPLVHVSFWR